MICRVLHWMFDQMRHPGVSDHFTHPLDDVYEPDLNQPSLWD